MTKLFVFCNIIFLSFACFAQTDSTNKNFAPVDSTKFFISPKASLANDSTVKDSAKVKKPFSPRTATIRSAILPGWGQIYNKKYWKLPIIYAGLGISAYVFFDNKKTYKDLRFAYAAKFKSLQTPPDTDDWDKVDEKYKNLSLSSLQYYRNEYRKYVDYSVLVFALLWGLNVVDATVDAHLKTFDVSDDISINLKAGYNQVGRNNGIAVVVNFK